MALACSRSPVELVLVTYVVAWAAVAGTVVVVSAFDGLSRWPIVAAALVGSSGAFYLRRRREALGDLLREAARGLRAAVETPSLLVLLVVVALALAYIGALAFFTTANDWDGLTYHVTRAALWVQDHRVGYVDAGDESRLNGNPPVAEIGMAASIAIGGDGRFLTLPAFLAVLVAPVAVFRLARLAGVDARGAVLAGLTFVSLPVVLLGGQSIMNDVVVATFMLIAVALLLSTSSREQGMGAVALGLGIGTKFVGALSVPLVLALVLVGSARGARLRAVGWAVLGIALGSPWYLLNLARTGSPEGGLADANDQVARHTASSMANTFRWLVQDTVDLSGTVGANLGVFFVVGGVLAAAGVIARLVGRASREAFVWVVVGAMVALTPLALFLLAEVLLRGYQKVWLLLGRSDLAFAEGGSWRVQRIADTSVSWFGALGTLILWLVVATAAVAVWRRRLRPLALAYALAPLVVIAIYAATITWDPWRGRLLMFPVGLATAVWGVAMRSQVASWCTVALATTTVGLTLVTAYTKPSGLDLFESSPKSIWHRDRIDAETIVRGYDATPNILRAVERFVPPDGRLAVIGNQDRFLAPLFGKNFTRTVDLVSKGSQPPGRSEWLLLQDVAKDGPPPLRGWQVRAEGTKHTWLLLRRAATMPR